MYSQSNIDVGRLVIVGTNTGAGVDTGVARRVGVLPAPDVMVASPEPTRSENFSDDM